MTATSKGEAGEAKIEILKTYYACAHALIKGNLDFQKIKSLQTCFTSLTSVTLIVHPLSPHPSTPRYSYRANAVPCGISQPRRLARVSLCLCD